MPSQIAEMGIAYGYRKYVVQQSRQTPLSKVEVVFKEATEKQNYALNPWLTGREDKEKNISFILYDTRDRSVVNKFGIAGLALYSDLKDLFPSIVFTPQSDLFCISNSSRISYAEVERKIHNLLMEGKCDGWYPHQERRTPDGNLQLSFQAAPIRASGEFVG